MRTSRQEPATSYDVELAGQLAAIGIVHGKTVQAGCEDEEDSRRCGGCRQRDRSCPELALRARPSRTGPITRIRIGATCCSKAARFSKHRRPPTREGHVQALSRDGRADLDSRTAFYYAYTLDSPGMIMRIPGVGSQYLMGFLDADGNPLDGARPTR